MIINAVSENNISAIMSIVAGLMFGVSLTFLLPIGKSDARIKDWSFYQ